MAARKTLAKKNPVVKKIASKPKSSVKLMKSVAMNVSKQDMADMINDLLKEKAAREEVDAASTSDEDEPEDKGDQCKGKGKTLWATDMEVELLELRCIDYDARFMSNKSVRQLSKYWSAIALSISEIARCEISGKQCKSKYNKMKQTYVGIDRQLKATGNCETIVFPPNWDKYVTYFGDKSGLGSTEYSGLVGDVDIEDDSEASETSGSDCAVNLVKDGVDGLSAFTTPDKPTHKDRTPTTDEQKQAEIKRQRDLRNEKKKNKLSVAGSIAAMGESIREGLIQSTQPVQQPDVSSKVVDALASMQASMRESARLQMLMIEMVQRALQGTAAKDDVYSTG